MYTLKKIEEIVFLELFAAVILVCIAVKIALSATIQIEVSATFRPAVKASGASSILLEGISINGQPNIQDSLTLSTDNAVNYLGNSLTLPVYSQTGKMRISAPLFSEDVEVYCSETGGITDGRGSKIPIEQFYIAVSGNNNNRCKGAKDSALRVIVNNYSGNTLHFGAKINGESLMGILPHYYSSSYLGGEGVRVNVFYK